MENVPRLQKFMGSSVFNTFVRMVALPQFDDRENFYAPHQLNAGVHKFIPQQMFENGPDALHFPYVHGSGEPATITRSSPNAAFTAGITHHTADMPGSFTR